MSPLTGALVRQCLSAHPAITVALAILPGGVLVMSILVAVWIVKKFRRGS